MHRKAELNCERDKTGCCICGIPLGTFLLELSTRTLERVLHLLKYLKGTRQAYLEYHQQGSAVPFGYSDADWAQNKGDRKSLTGFILNMAGAPITWSFKGQATIALSSTEAEYVALSATAKEALWLRSVLLEMGRELPAGTKLHEVNESAMKLVKNPVLHARSKHIDICHYAIRQFAKDGKLQIERKSTDQMVADMLTKPLSGGRIQYLAEMTGIQLNARRWGPNEDSNVARNVGGEGGSRDAR